jgi:hypothetical protein
MTPTTAPKDDRRKVPAEFVNIVGTSLALLGVVATGSAIVSATPDPNVAQFAAAYLGPASLAFAAYWWVARKL